MTAEDEHKQPEEEEEEEGLQSALLWFITASTHHQSTSSSCCAVVNTDCSQRGSGTPEALSTVPREFEEQSPLLVWKNCSELTRPGFLEQQVEEPCDTFLAGGSYRCRSR